MHSDGKISPEPKPRFWLKSISVLLVLFPCSTGFTYGQLLEEFSDGELLTNPSWSGTTDDFQVNAAYELQLQASAAGTSWIVTPFEAPLFADISWTFRIRQTFAPSGANFGRVYITSDQENLSQPLNGYYVQFGEAGALDAVSLYRQTGTRSTLIARGIDGRIASAFDLVVKVVRSSDGNWELFTRTPEDENFTFEADGVDDNKLPTGWFGLRCTYTISNATRFYFDDIAIEAMPASDEKPPHVLAVRAISGKTVLVTFSEPVEIRSAEEPMHYTLNPGSRHPHRATLIAADEVELHFATPLVNGDTSKLITENVADTAGNVMGKNSNSFFFYEPQPWSFGDLVINEIMADPSPVVGLPDAEYVEITNRSGHPILLDGWSFADDGSSAALPPIIIRPGDIFVLCDSRVADEFRNIPLVPISRFPSLNNSGDHLKLISPNGNVIDSVDYTDQWYRDSQKAGGGWSLERIDPNNLCEGATNWTASESPQGGTPGHVNSVFASKPDRRGPEVLTVAPSDEHHLIVAFNEKLSRRLPTALSFTIQPTLPIIEVGFADPERTKLRLTLDEPIKPGIPYFLSVEDVYDCPGNRMEPSTPLPFILPEIASPGDVIINEILFNPRPGGVDFVELFNASEKVIDLRNWSMRNVKSRSPGLFVATSQTTLIPPGMYKLLTPSPEIIKGEYVSSPEEAFIETPLPPMNDDEGVLALFDGRGERMDSLIYSEDMHSPFLRNPEGVSLERIAAGHPGYDRENWRSASSTTGFATPGYANSNTRNVAQPFENTVVVEPEVLRKNVPGQDFAQIHYRFPAGGYIANVVIYDSQGRRVKHIAENQLLGTDGFFRWDGDKEDGARVATGSYFVSFSAFGAAGEQSMIRKRVIVFP